MACPCGHGRSHRLLLVFPCHQPCSTSPEPDHSSHWFWFAFFLLWWWNGSLCSVCISALLNEPACCSVPSRLTFSSCFWLLLNSHPWQKHIQDLPLWKTSIYFSLFYIQEKRYFLGKSPTYHRANTQRDKLLFTPSGNLESPIHRVYWTVGGNRSIQREPTQAKPTQTFPIT